MAKTPKYSKIIRVCHATWGKLGGKTLPHYGLHNHFLEAVLVEAGYTVKTDIINWARCVESVKMMKHDMTMAWESEKLKKDFQFFSYGMKTPMNFYTKISSPLKNGSFEIMKEKRVAYVRETGGLDNFYKNESMFQSVAVNSVDQLFNMIEWDRIDAFIIDPMSFDDEISKKFPHLKGKIKALQPPIQENIISPMIYKKHPKKSEIEKAYENAYKKVVNRSFIQKLEKIHKVKIYR
ncbi:MAG: ABC transporter substrate-binding protein [Leptospiraceae bacterium]|nr:ABC transporter substrate-binding protein [Leptospiraceae bacterium]MCP5500195.1 ABC transporter substrate-binding protein [Leptospiraceae bacterium]